MEILDDRARQARPHPRAERQAERIDGERIGASPAREIVCDDRSGRRRTAGFANAHPNAGEQELPVILGKAEQRGHRRPQDHRGGDDVAAVRTVGHLGNRQPDRNVEESQSHPGKPCNARIAQPEFLADRLQHCRHDIAIGDIDRIDQAKHQHDIPARGIEARCRRWHHEGPPWPVTLRDHRSFSVAA